MQIRERLRIPPAHDTEHSSQSNQSCQYPSTAVAGEGMGWGDGVGGWGGGMGWGDEPAKIYQIPHSLRYGIL